MSDSTSPDPKNPDEYEAPAIEERTEIEDPLVAVVSSVSPPSAAFHPADDAAASYEAPAIEERTQVNTPLIGTSLVPCASFRP